MRKKKNNEKVGSKVNCLSILKAEGSKFPHPRISAAFAYAPEELAENKLGELRSLFNSSATFREMIEKMRKDRPWLAPSYGYKGFI